jgi:hypothetical protein
VRTVVDHHSLHCTALFNNDNDSSSSSNNINIRESPAGHQEVQKQRANVTTSTHLPEPGTSKLTGLVT